MQREDPQWGGAHAMNGKFMTGVLRVKSVYFLGASLLVASPAFAQDEPLDEIVLVEPIRDDWVTVVVTGTREHVELSGQSASIIAVEELERVQGPDLTRALERLPGVSFARSGGLGSQTALFVRGANSEQLKVLVDGIPLEDTAAPSGGFDLGTLVGGGIGKIELLRGSNSLVWGSDAIGGVLAVTTNDRDGQRASLEYGARNSFDAQANVGLVGTDSRLGLAGGFTRTDGISAFAGGNEVDAFRQWHVGGRGQLGLSDDFSLVASGRYADSKVDFDGYPAPAYVFADTAEYQTTRQGSGRVGLRYANRQNYVEAGVALSDTRRAYFDPAFGSAPGFETSGRSIRADLQGRVWLSGDWELNFGADSTWSRFSTTFDPRQTSRLSGAHALLSHQFGKLQVSGGARYDDHDRFGGKATFGANARLDLGHGWRLRSSFGEGFKAPTLYQLYGYGGNVLLKPETSTAFDAGIEHGNRNAGLHFAATLFRRDSTNLIDYVWPSGYFNIGRTRAQGFELEGAAQVSERFSVRAAYTFLDATNRATGKQLARRPRHALSASADWTTPLAGLALGADLRLVGDSFDDAGNFTRLDGHALLTLRATVPLGEHLELYGRVENVTDAQYQTVAGYGSYGRSAYGGVRLKW